MRIRVTKFREMKETGEPIVSVTAYDYMMAQLADSAGIPLILVGDSLGNVVLGYGSTVHVTMSDMIHHAKAVVRGASKAFIAVDLPFMSYQASDEEAVRNAGRIIQETGAQAVKLEGGVRSANAISRIVDVGIPVMGHIGLTPQSEHALGGFRIQGTGYDTANKLLADAQAVENAGAFAVVIETVPEELSKLLTERLSIPTIGIGAGKYCDGQIQVLHDIIGLSGRSPNHAKVYAALKQSVQQALLEYSDEVSSGIFPSSEHRVTMDSDVLKEIITTLNSEK